jgi:hypothetical protein
MSSSRKFLAYFATMALVSGFELHPAKAELGCPPLHNGKPLRGVGLFDGSPSERMELMPRPGRFVINEGDKPSSRTLPNFTLGCRYHGTNEVITVVLPLHIRICEFTDGPQVACR